MADLPARRWLVRGLLGVVVLALVVSSGVLTLAYDAPDTGAGPVESPANGTTVVTSQGWHADGYSLPGRSAQLAAVGPNASAEWTHDGPADTRSWFYDVDPLPNGNLLVVNPVRETTVVYEYDPERGERVWTERFDLPDIHDVDLINDDELLVAGINYDEDRESRDSVFVYNRTRGEVTWEWYFEDHYPDDAGAGVTAKDWTHVNDVDQIRDGEFLVSPRNFDQVIAINRSTKDIDLRLGEDGDRDTLYEQHNPQYLESENGTPTILVADSENDRIVEYERTDGPPGDGEWERVWTVSEGLNWPRDADRLPNGNTLVVDSMNHRVVEVTPTGEIVWETSVPWATYDAERVAHGDEPGGPTIRDQGAAGAYELRGGSDSTAAGLPTVPAVVGDLVGGTPVSEPVVRLAERWYHVAPWFTPMWLPTWSATFLAVALALLVGWGVGEGVYNYALVRRRLGELRDTLRERLWRSGRG
ncbi:aryl-sulfate sulfotransferase [Halorussus amylolyticus]|uniref:aryl-sulfate sulfotransferase n=1 Tax=Halorussus amylolyticus TaxID=1126242 RepID=UPI00104A109D|nr:aryl-sulfate sulfotransferase [Halorussus amylolyticus]